MAEGRSKVKITLNRSLVYYFDVWVGDQVGQEAFLEMEFMVPAGIRLELAEQFICWKKSDFICKVEDHRMGQRYNDLPRMRSTWGSRWVTP